MGLSQLTVSTTLTNSSVWKSRHMARYAYMAHNDPAPPVARTTSERLAACGYPWTTTGWGENIAYGYTTPEAVMQGWLNSPGHRANIETASFRSIGVGAASSTTGRIYSAQAFGTQAGSTPPPPRRLRRPTSAPTARTTTATARSTTRPTPAARARPTTTSSTHPHRRRRRDYACSNGADDDGDVKVDYPNDPGCVSSTDNDEYNAPHHRLRRRRAYNCSNGRDDDGDGKIDYPADPGCTSSTDNNEYNARHLRPGRRRRTTVPLDDGALQILPYTPKDEHGEEAGPSRPRLPLRLDRRACPEGTPSTMGTVDGAPRRSRRAIARCSTPFRT